MLKKEAKWMEEYCWLWIEVNWGERLLNKGNSNHGGN